MFLKNKIDQKGQIIILALILPIIFIGALTATIGWSSSVYRAASVSQNKESALQIAEAGVNYYRWHLAHEPNDFYDGTGQPGPYEHDFADKQGNIVGRFSLEITPPPLGSTIVKIKSTGYTLSQPGVKKTLLLTVGKPSFAKYAVVSDNDMRFGSGTEIFGPIQVNGGIRFDGIAHNSVSSGKLCYNDPDLNWSPSSCSNSGINYEKPGIWSGNDAAASVNVNGSGVITGVTVSNSNRGSNYTSAPSVSFYNSTGSGAVAHAQISGGGVSSVVVDNGGSGYTSSTAVSFTGGNNGGQFLAGKNIGASTISFSALSSDLADMKNKAANRVVSVITITDNGIGYTSAPTVEISGGGGTGARAIAVINGGKVVAINITDGGTGYASTPSVALTGGGGSNASATAVVTYGFYQPFSSEQGYHLVLKTNNTFDLYKVTSVVPQTGIVTGIAVTNQGSNYTSIPTVSVVSSNAAAVAGMRLRTIDISSQGNNYNSPPTVQITGGGGSGAVATAVLGGSNGKKVVSVTINNRGSDYTLPPNISFIPTDGGSGAAATSTIGVNVTSINIANGGSNYSSAPLVFFTGGGGTGAAATSSISGGVITSINVTNGGSNYTSNPAVYIAASDSGATATATIAGGKVTGISVDNGGGGYASTPSVFITGGGGTGAAATATLGSCDNPTWGISAQSLVSGSPFQFPPDGLMFFEDNIWVEGALENTRLNIGSSRFAPTNPSGQASVIINNDITYAHNDGSEALGLIAEKDVNIGLFSEDDLVIDAALIAQNGRIGRNYYGFNCGPEHVRSSITTYGILATSQRYGFAYTDNTGYLIRNLNYDGNLLYAPPPDFPLTADQYEVISWEEVKN